MELLWSDEFDSNNNGDDNGNGNGSGNDSVHHQINGNHPNWNVRSGFLGLNGEFQTYTTSPSNVEIRNGKLHLTAVRDMSQQVGYSSGRVNTRNKMHFKYGMVEASIKIPDMSLGLWPALWTLGENYDQVGWPKAGELDIMEIGDKRGFAENNKLNHRVLSAVHWEAFGHYTVEDGYLDMPDNLSQDFHTYKMIWQPDHVEMFVDNFSIHRVRLQDCDTLWDCTELHQPHYLILNLAVAGLFTCCEHGFALNDYPEGTSWTMQVDYVRLYGNEHTEVFFPTSSSDNDSITSNNTSTSPTGSDDSDSLLTNTITPKESPSATVASNPPSFSPVPSVSPSVAATEMQVTSMMPSVSPALLEPTTDLPTLPAPPIIIAEPASMPPSINDNNNNSTFLEPSRNSSSTLPETNTPTQNPSSTFESTTIAPSSTEPIFNPTGMPSSNPTTTSLPLESSTDVLLVATESPIVFMNETTYTPTSTTMLPTAAETTPSDRSPSPTSESTTKLTIGQTNEMTTSVTADQFMDEDDQETIAPSTSSSALLTTTSTTNATNTTSAAPSTVTSLSPTPMNSSPSTTEKPSLPPFEIGTSSTQGVLRSSGRQQDAFLLGLVVPTLSLCVAVLHELVYLRRGQ